MAERTVVALPPPGVSRVVDIALDQEQTYAIDMKADDFLHVEVSQNQVDIVVELSGPGFSEALRIDSPTGTDSPEKVLVVAEKRGEYLLNVALDSKSLPGTYTIRQVELPHIASQEDRLRVSALLGFMRAEQWRQQPDKAIGYYEAAMLAWRNLDRPADALVVWRRAIRTLINVGNIERAVEHCEEASTYFPLDMPSQESALINYECGIAYRFSGAVKQALDFLQRSRDASEKISYIYGQATALHGLALWHRDRGELSRALTLAREALTLFSHLGKTEAKASALHLIGTLLILMDKPENALDYLDQALDIRMEAGQDPGRTLARIGLALARVDRKDAAIEKLEQARTQQRRSGNRHGEATTLDWLGSIYLELSKPEKGLQLYREALGIFEKLGDRGSTVNTRTNVGMAHLALGRPYRAKKVFKLALDQAQDLNTEAHIRIGLARSARQLGELEVAHRHYGLAFDSIESQRANAPGPSLRASYFATWQDEYTDYVDLLTDLHQRFPERGFAALAFRFSEQARSRSLLDLLAREPFLLPEDLSPVLRSRERVLREQFSAEVRELVLDASSPGKELRRLSLEYEMLREKIWPEGAANKGADAPPKSLDLAEVQELLDDETLLLSYRLGENRSFLWLVGARSFEVFELSARATIERKAAELYQLLPKSDERRARSQVGLVATELSKELLSPVSDKLGSKRLLVVSDGKLHYIPFSMLPKLGSSTSSEPMPLVVEHEIVHLPSASVLDLLRQRRMNEPEFLRDVVVLSDPVFSASDERVPEFAKSASGGAESRFPRLPSSKEEADAILALAPPGRNLEYSGFDVTKERIIEGDFAYSRILHFATHSWLYDPAPEYSAILLSQFDQKGAPRDGLLHLHEIFSLNLPVDLVVLSVCETALGAQVRGEGIVGMTQGFLTAGASRVVVSLWSIDDRATARFMEEFYRRLFEFKLAPAAALRAAQLTMLHDDSHSAPLFWAGFVLQGEWL